MCPSAYTTNSPLPSKLSASFFFFENVLKSWIYTTSLFDLVSVAFCLVVSSPASAPLADSSQQTICFLGSDNAAYVLLETPDLVTLVTEETGAHAKVVVACSA